MYICIYVCMYVYIYVCMYVCMYICMYICIYVCVYVYICICVYICIYEYIRKYMYIYIYICVYICIYIYLCMYVYIYFQTIAELSGSWASNCINLMYFQELSQRQALTVSGFKQPRRTLVCGQQSCVHSHIHARHTNVPRQRVHQGVVLVRLGCIVFSWLNNRGVGRVM